MLMNYVITRLIILALDGNHLVIQLAPNTVDESARWIEARLNASLMSLFFPRVHLIISYRSIVCLAHCKPLVISVLLRCIVVAPYVSKGINLSDRKNSSALGLE